MGQTDSGLSTLMVTLIAIIAIAAMMFILYSFTGASEGIITQLFASNSGGMMMPFAWLADALL